MAVDAKRLAKGALFFHKPEPLLQGDARSGDLSLQPGRWRDEPETKRESGAGAKTGRRVRSGSAISGWCAPGGHAVRWPERTRGIRERRRGEHRAERAPLRSPVAVYRAGGDAGDADGIAHSGAHVGFEPARLLYRHPQPPTSSDRGAAADPPGGHDS